MKKSFLFVIIALFLVAVLVACGGKTDTPADEPKEEEQPAKEDTPVVESGEKTLRVSFGLGESEWAVFRNEILPAFEQTTGIKVEAVQIDSEDLVNKLNAEINAGNLSIDMFAQDVNNLSGLVIRDLIEDLSEYRNLIPDSVIPGMIEVSEFENKLLFLPYRPNVEITFYNDEKLSELGVELPQTWEELLAVAKQLKDETNQGRVAIKANLQGDNILHMFDFIRGAGGDPYVLNDEGSIEAFTFMQELYPYLAETSSTANWDTMNSYLETDNVYIGKNWPFYIGEFNRNGKHQIQAYGGWSGPARVSNALGGEVIGIPKGSEKVEEAILFAEFLMSKEVQELLVSELAWPSVRSDAYGLVQGYQVPFFEAIRDALDHAEPRGNVPYWEDAESIYLDAFQRIVVNGEDVKTVLDASAAKLDELR